jgi:hypothetical protein
LLAFLFTKCTTSYSAIYGIAQICHIQERFAEAYPFYRKASVDEALKNTDISRTARFMVARYVTSLYSAASTNDPDSVTKADAFTILLNLAEREQYHAAYFWVADCYERGMGVSKSVEDALQWFQLAADQCLDMTVEAERRIARLQAIPIRGEDLECIPEESEEGESDAGMVLNLRNMQMIH